MTEMQVLVGETVIGEGIDAHLHVSNFLDPQHYHYGQFLRRPPEIAAAYVAAREAAR